MLAAEGGARRGRRALGALLVALALAVATAPAARAELFTVDQTGDQSDAALGDEICEIAGGGCTLRAAIEESNASVGESDRIFFEEEPFDGSSTAVIAPGSPLPPIEDKVAIESKECPSESHHPCAGIEGPSGVPALVVHDTEGVKVTGLSIAGAGIGIEVEGSPKLVFQGNWVGVKLDGSAGGNETGVLLGPGSDGATIGSEGVEGLNVFAGNAADGLDIHGASGTKVLGNYFGVERDGTTALSNGKDIEVTSVSGGAPASGTTIGTRLKPGPAVSPECDGGCNLISDSGGSGIDLVGDGGPEAPAALTTILGNYIGLDAGGDAAIPNTADGVRVGTAGQTVVGGLKSGEANRINGGMAAIVAGPGAPDLLVRGNQIGLDAFGGAGLAPPGEGIAVDSTGLSSAAVEATIAGNAIEVSGGAGIDQQGYGATISGNEIHGAGTGIRTHGSDTKHGNLIAGNAVQGPQGSGIAVENELNEIAGNEVTGAGGAGILVKGSAKTSVAQNVVGGDAAAAENVVSGGAAAAIEISDVEASENEVARNRGIANSGPFIELVAAGSESKGPNKGILPPAFASATEAGASGSAKAGARVRVFRKQLAAAGELQSFLGEAVADAEGDWQLSYGAPLPPGTIVAATQTLEGGTSELAMATTVGGEAGSGGAMSAAGPILAPGTRLVSPQTWIVKAPARTIRTHTAHFAFQADEPGSRFQCSLDAGAFRPCRSPKAYAGLRPGSHVFEVRAVDRAGDVDPSPARKRFAVVGGGHGRGR